MHLLMSQSTLFQLYCEIVQNFITDLRLTVGSLYVLQRPLQPTSYRLFEDALQCVNHAKRMTVMPKDIQLAHHICWDY